MKSNTNKTNEPKKLKTQVITVSRNFLSGHPKAGQPTYFAHKLLAAECNKEGLATDENGQPKVIIGQKLHTIRDNYSHWVKVAERVKVGEMILSIRQWIGKPYQSTQHTLTNTDKMGVQEITMINGVHGFEVYVENKAVDIETIAKNDGLSREDFEAWFAPYFKRRYVFTGVIIHFTDFRY